MRNVRIDDEVLVGAANQYGTPCLCYEEQEIEYWRSSLINAIPDRAQLIYSVKASPSPILLKNYISHGMYFETASDGELSLLLSLGADPQKIWVSGQGKTIEYLQNAVWKGISHFHIESANELRLLSSLIDKADNYVCCIRINPNLIRNDSILHTAGKASSFGVDEEQAWKILNEDYRGLINGLFLYCGSQYFSAESIIDNTATAFRLAQKFYRLTKRKIKAVDFGGGFGVPEKDSTPELNLKDLRIGLDILFEKYQQSTCFHKDSSFYFESGRYLAARTACLVTSILDIKESRGVKFVITDGGINHLGVKQLEYRLYPPYIRHIGKKQHGLIDVYCITGNTCTPIDQTHPGAQLDTPSVGDYICIPDCGGYSLSFSPQNFNGYYSIPEVLHCSEGIVAYKSRGDFDSVRKQSEFVPIGTGMEIHQLLTQSCPLESDEVQNVVVAAETIKLNGLKCIVCDITDDGTEAVILLKILKKHYNLVPDAVYSDYGTISSFTSSPCYCMEEFIQATSTGIFAGCFIMFITSEGANNDVVDAMSHLTTHCFNYMTIKSELIDSMELNFYRFYLHNIPELQSAYNLLGDITSKKCFIEYIRTTLENDFWRQSVSPLNAKYWGYDSSPFRALYTHLADEKWLNIGACNGDTIFRFLANGYQASRIYAVDTDYDSIERCKENLKQINNRSIRDIISYHHVCFGTNNNVRIDEYFKNDSLTLINMDIEGAEKDTIKSASGIIKKDRPVLAVCVYHKPEDICEIIETIHKIDDAYTFYLRKYPNYPYHRYNSKEEIVLYAIPKERLANKCYVK